MLNNYYASGGKYRAQVFTRLVIPAANWLIGYGYLTFTEQHERVLLASTYFPHFAALALSGLVFLLLKSSLLLLGWRFLLELTLCLIMFSVPVQIAHWNQWHAVNVIVGASLLFYFGVFLLSFVFWRDTKNRLFETAQLYKKEEQTYFDITRRGYYAVYHLRPGLHWLKKLYFWETTLFEKQVVTGGASFRGVMGWVIYGILAGIALLHAFTEFDILGLIAVVVTLGWLPQIMRVSILPAFWDLLLCSLYKTEKQPRF